MNELSLFSGAGGGLLASHLLGWRTVGYVEFNDYCQRVIAARIQDGHLDAAPIFGDIQAFISDGYAVQYQGVADVVSGGFPCQPFSVAGKQAAADDPRNMWPATLEVIRLVRPRFAFLENVPGLLAQSHGYFGTILQGLAEVGYDARWTVLSAADCGAPHLRKRLWIVGTHTDGRRQQISAQLDGEAQQIAPDRDPRRGHSHGLRDEMADPACPGQPDHKGGCEQARERGRSMFAHSSWWDVEPDVGRVAHGVAGRVGQLQALGNGQVPAVAAAAWRLLTS